jgi:hypothetical protein
MSELNLVIDEKVLKKANVAKLEKLFLYENLDKFFDNKLMQENVMFKLSGSKLSASLSFNDYIDTKIIELFCRELSSALKSNSCIQLLSSGADSDFVVSNSVRSSWGESRKEAEKSLKQPPPISNKTILNNSDLLCTFSVKNKKLRSWFFETFSKLIEKEIDHEEFKKVVIARVCSLLDETEEGALKSLKFNFELLKYYPPSWVEQSDDYIFIYFPLDQAIRSDLIGKRSDYCIESENERFCTAFTDLIFWLLYDSGVSSLKVKLREKSTNEERNRFFYSGEMCFGHREGIKPDNDWNFGA